MELLKREQKHHSLGNPFNIPPQKKTYPSRHFDSTRFWNLTTQNPPCWKLCRWSDFQEFPPDELLQHHNLSSQPDFLRSMRVSSDEFDRWFVDDGNLSKPEVSDTRFPPRRRWVQLKLPTNLWKSTPGQKSIRTYKRHTLYISFSLSSGIPLLYVIFFAKSTATRRFGVPVPLIAITKSKRDRPVWKKTSEKHQVSIETELRLGFLGPGWVFKTFGFFKTTLCKFLHLPHLVGRFWKLRDTESLLTLTQGHCLLGPSNLTLWIWWSTCTL